MPWEKTYNESDVLDRAMHAFWSRGSEGTSMHDLVKAMGINRGSIYAAYDSKHALFLRVIKRYDDVQRKQFFAEVSRIDSPKEKISTVFEKATVRNRKRPRGCLLVNSALEMSPHDSQVRQIVDRCFAETETFFFEHIEEAKARGEIGISLSSRETAQALLGLFLGLRVLTRSTPNPRAVGGVLQTVESLLK